MNLDVYMLTLRCMNKECMLRVRIGRILSKPAMIIGEFKICPLCGGRAATGQDAEENYWETLAKAYEIPVELVKMMYDSWNTQEFQRFSDYVNQLKREVAEEVA